MPGADPLAVGTRGVPNKLAIDNASPSGPITTPALPGTTTSLVVVLPHRAPSALPLPWQSTPTRVVVDYHLSRSRLPPLLGSTTTGVVVVYQTLGSPSLPVWDSVPLRGLSTTFMTIVNATVWYPTEVLTVVLPSC